MHVLGISCGTFDGNSELLLKMALQEITTQVPGTTISILRISTVAIPSTPSADFWAPDKNISNEPDDRPAALDAIMKADAIIIASPIWTRSPAGTLKYFCDKTLGPLVDAAFVKRAVEGKASPNSQLGQKRFDERVLKPRVAGLIAVGGATSDEWGTLALPGLHQSIFSLHAKVVDQMIVYGAPFPGTILLKEFQEARDKAKKLGRNIASQMGKTYDDAEYLGDMKGACPICHLNVVDLNVKGGGVTCGTCGAKGRLVMNGDVGVIELGKEKTSVLTMEGKIRHMDELREVGIYFEPKKPLYAAEREKWMELNKYIVKTSKL